MKIRNSLGLKMLSLGAAAVVAGSVSSQAAVFYGVSSAAANSDWNVSANWNSEIDGSGSAPGSSGFAGNDFVIAAGRIMGTPSGDTTFSGASLTVSGTLFVRNNAGSAFTKSVAKLTTETGSTIYSNVSNRLLVTGTTTINGATNLTIQASNVNPTFNFGTLTGSSDLILTLATGANNILTLDAASATGYTGTIGWSGTPASGAHIISLDFGSGLTFGGGLVANDLNSRIRLDENVTFASVTLNGNSLAAGTYLYSDFLTGGTYQQYNTIFAGSTAGSITVVPEPATLACVIGGLGFVLIGRRRMSRVC